MTAKLDVEFLKFSGYGEVSSRIKASPHEWSIIEAHLEKIGVRFRSPNR